MKYLKILGISILSLLLTGCLLKRDTMEDIDIYTTIYPLNYPTLTVDTFKHPLDIEKSSFFIIFLLRTLSSLCYNG